MDNNDVIIPWAEATDQEKIEKLRMEMLSLISRVELLEHKTK